MKEEKLHEATNVIIHSIWPFYAKYLICEPNKNTEKNLVRSP